MGFQWGKSSVKGLRFREHPTKTVGAGKYKRPLRYYVMTFKWRGRTVSEGLGWENEIFTEWRGKTIIGEEAAEHIFSQLRNNRQSNVPPFTLAELRADNKAVLEEATRQAEAEKVKNMTFAEIWNDSYYPFIQANRRSQRAIETEELLFRLWINPVIGNLPLAKIATLPHIEKLKKTMKTAGKSARTIRYALDVVRQVFNHADLKNIYRGRNPAAGRQVKRPQEDNRRNRSLSPAESDTLLSTLLKHSRDVHDMALLSVHAGLRYGEVASLKWGDVDIFAGQGVLVDTKSGKNRPFYMTEQVKTMFAKRQPPKSKSGDLVFPDQNGNRQLKISRTFRLVTDALFNQDVTDSRNKVVFHSLRRTFATQLLNQGTSIYHIQRLLGHADITTTTRYLDVDGKDLKDAVLKAQQG
jgi:integrase